jgi:hypothetical protein
LPNGTAMYDYLVGVNPTLKRPMKFIKLDFVRWNVTKEIDALQIK